MAKPLYTCGVTVLEAFRFWLYGQSESNESWNTEAKLIETIKGEYKANIKADYGSLGHLIIEEKGNNTCELSKGVYGFKSGDLTITWKQAQPILKYQREHPLMVRETEVSKLYSTPSFDLIVTGHIDGLEGIMVRDNKFKFSSFDMMDYIDSYQHRFYLDMVGLDHFWYDFFRVDRFEVAADCPKAIIRDCESLLVVRYPEMEADINSLLVDFADYVQHRQLLPWLKITRPKYEKILAGDPSLETIIRERLSKK